VSDLGKGVNNGAIARGNSSVGGRENLIVLQTVRSKDANRTYTLIICLWHEKRKKTSGSGTD